MHPTRLVLLLAVILLSCASSVAQQPGPQFWRKVGCEPFEPRTKLEQLDETYGTVIIKGFTRITTVEVRGVRIDAVEMRASTFPNRAKGIVVSLREGGEQRTNDNRAFVDYEELDALLKAIDTVSRVDESVTQLASFEARYKTRGDLELGVFRQTQRGTAVSLTTGICDRATQTMTLDDLGKVKAMIQEAKARLEEIR